MPPTTPHEFVWVAVSLLLGGVALHVGAHVAVDHPGSRRNTFEYALVTALLGAVVWAALSVVPLVGPLLAFVGWLGLVKWRYDVGLVRTAVITAVAWAVAVLVVAALSLVGVDALSALGVPGA